MIDDANKLASPSPCRDNRRAQIPRLKRPRRQPVPRAAFRLIPARNSDCMARIACYTRPSSRLPASVRRS